MFGHTQLPAEKPKFPPIVCVNNRKYVTRGSLNRHKDALVAYAMGLSFNDGSGQYEDNSLVPLKQAATELGVGRRTIGRRIKEEQSLLQRHAAD